MLVHYAFFNDSILFLLFEQEFETHKMGTYNWHAIYTKSRTEKKVMERMQKSGYEVYLPMQKTMRQWSDRKKKVEVPLIASYVFVKVSEREYYDVLQTPDAVAYVSFEGKAAVIPEKQIDVMKTAVDNSMQIELSTEQLEEGEKVKVIAGPLKGAEGELVGKVKKRKFILNLGNVGFLLKIEVNANDVVKL